MDAAIGTRTFTILNDTARSATRYNPCSGVHVNRTTKVEPGAREEVTSSIFGEFYLATLTSSRYVPVGCLNVSSIPQGSTDEVLTVSSAIPCVG